MYGEAIKAYEQSLRNNPKDNETRYNLALCKRLQKKQDNKNNQNKKQEKVNFTKCSMRENSVKIYILLRKHP